MDRKAWTRASFVALVFAALVGFLGCGGLETARPRSCGAGNSTACSPKTDAGTDAHAVGDAAEESGTGSGVFGAACESNADCAPKLFCMHSDSTALAGEGPAHGMCTRDCSREATTCFDMDPTAVCVTGDESAATAYCMAGCRLGTPAVGAPAKCAGRSDLACFEFSLQAGTGYCLPTCRTDADCAPRACDGATGLCMDTKAPGNPIGTACVRGAGSCSAGCVPFNPASGGGECSAVCQLGSAGCGKDDSKGPPYDAYCLFGDTDLSGRGDSGYCVALCDCDDDCSAGLVCAPRPDVAPDTGRKGFCTPKSTTDAGPSASLPCH